MIPEIDPGPPLPPAALPKPSAFALRLVERHRGAFDASLPTLRLPLLKPRAHEHAPIDLEVLRLVVVPATPLPLPQRIVELPALAANAAPTVEWEHAETTDDEAPPFDEPCADVPVIELIDHTDRVALAPIPSAPDVALPWTPTPGSTDVPAWALMLACWLASAGLAAILWVATAP